MRLFVQTVEGFVNESMNNRDLTICRTWCHFFHLNICGTRIDSIPRAVTIKCKHVFFVRSHLCFVSEAGSLLERNHLWGY